MAYCDTRGCRQVARIAIVSGPRYISYRCAHHGLQTARQILDAGRMVRIDPLVPSKVNSHVCSDGAYYQSDVDATAHQQMLDQKAIEFAARIDRLARTTHEAQGAGDLAS